MIGLFSKPQLRAVLLSVVAILATNASQSVRNGTVEGTPICPTCRIELRKVATLGSPADPELLREFFPNVAVDATGGFLVNAFGGTFVLFDSAGRFLRLRGKVGQGPGEFGRAADEVFPVTVDSVFVLAGADVLLLNRNWEEKVRFGIRGSNLMGRSRTILGDGSFVESGIDLKRSETRASPDTNRVMVRVFSPNADTLSWAFRKVPSSSLCLSCEVLDLAPASAPKEFWTLSAREYVFRRWRKDGTLLEAINVVNSDWFGRWTQVRSDLTPPRPGTPVMRLSLRRDGLFVVGAVGPATDFRGIPSLAAGVRLSAQEHLVRESGFAASVIEVVDPLKGVLASTRIEHSDLRLISPDFAIRYAVHSSGITQVEVWKIEFMNR